MQVSYSRISTYNTCPYQFYLRYKEGLETIFNCDPQNPLVLGHAMHTGIEKDVPTAIHEYLSAYPVIRDAHITEAMKLEYLIPKTKAILPKGEHEVYIETPNFHGYIDLLAPVEPDVYDIYDFKYSNNVAGYTTSAQLHLYKYYFELTHPHATIRNLYFVFIPKCHLKQKYANKTNPRDETIHEFRKRCLNDLKSKEIKIQQIEYDPDKITEFVADTKRCLEDDTYKKVPSRLCDWCEYNLYCQKGIDYMNLPKNERREKVVITDPDMWIYADSYVGKSTFVDQLDDVIFANTDGNTENITSPVVRIMDEVIQEGRITRKILAWEKFLEFVDELEKKDNDFKVVALDLMEDLYEHCRLYIYDKLGIEHEQDAGFGKGWDMVRTEFLSTIKRLKNLGYRIVYISKELKTEINLKSGAKITSFAPNIPDKVANVLAGTVTLTARAFMNNRGRFLQLAKEENIFGGGRFNFVHDTCPLDMDAFIEELKLAQGDVKPTKRTTKPVEPAKPVEKPEEPAEAESQVTTDEALPWLPVPAEETPRRRRREEPAETPTKAAAEAPAEEAPTEETPTEETPRRRRRRAE